MVAGRSHTLERRGAALLAWSLPLIFAQLQLPYERYKQKQCSVQLGSSRQQSPLYWGSSFHWWIAWRELRGTSGICRCENGPGFSPFGLWNIPTFLKKMCVCVCVNRYNKRSILRLIVNKQFAGGCWGSLWSASNEDTTMFLWYGNGTLFPRTCHWTFVQAVTIRLFQVIQVDRHRFCSLHLYNLTLKAT